MNSHLIHRARQMKTRTRRLLCERLERRYAMHAMPWGYDWLEDARNDFAEAESSADSAVADCREHSSALRGEGEAQDTVTGNLIPNARGLTAGSAHGLSNSNEAFRDRVSANSNSSGDASSQLVGNDRVQEIVRVVVEVIPTASIKPSAFASNSGIDTHVGTTSQSTSLSSTVSLSGSSDSRATLADSSSRASTPDGPSVAAQIGSTFGGNANSNNALHADILITPSPARTSSISRQSTDLTTIQSAVAASARTTDVTANSNLVSMSTTSYANARSLDVATSAKTTSTADLTTNHGAANRPTSTDTDKFSESLEVVIENLARQRDSQRSAAGRHSAESGWDDSLAINAVARAYQDRANQDVVHADGLLELATRPERMTSTSSQEAYAAIDDAHSDRLSMTLVQVGMVRQFELAGEHLGNIDLIANPEKMLRKTTSDAVAALDQWHSKNESSAETASEALDGDNSVLDRSLLPLSFLAVGGMLIASRRKYSQRLRLANKKPVVD